MISIINICNTCGLFKYSKQQIKHKLLYRHQRFFGLSTGYEPKTVEKNRNVWQTKNTKQSDNYLKFSMILPPPNVTGLLHLGHALMCTVQDVIARWKRENKYDVAWIPGTDHAGIATQVVVEKQLFQETKQNRHVLGREEFLKRVWHWKDEKGNFIKDDLKNIGATLDWTQEYFTMDEHQANAVTEAFIRLFEDDLIYRNECLVNWSCSLESAISDIEVEHIEINEPTLLSIPGYDKAINFGEITNIAYKLYEKETEIIVSTTRPETLLGDVAIAVHPNDSRYAHLQNKDSKAWHPFREETIPIIFDESVNPEFGTGALKITPAHDPLDFEIAKRNSLQHICVINEKGLITNNHGEFSGIPRFIAREKMKNDLAILGLLRDTKPHKMLLPICSRSKDVIEYLLKPQWFIRCKHLSQDAIKAVENESIKIIPQHFQNDWYRWLSESRDWCISRQLWWGHRIPAYECSFYDKTIWVAAKNKDDARVKASKLLNENSQNAIKVVQDTDVLDTWFSSALLPFSVFGWPHSNIKFKKYYPLDVLETGHDILFFWVARMVMLALKLTGEVPFKNILLHGILCDVNGRKMSKSLGNVISPNQIISGASLKDLSDETSKLFKSGILSDIMYRKSIEAHQKMFPNGIPTCGTDALRFTLCSHNIKNHFINFDAHECYTNKLFLNKIWQATRYTLQSFHKSGLNIENKYKLNDYELSHTDKWILSRLGNTMKIIENSMDDYNFHISTNALKTFFYMNFCNVYLETTKISINSDNKALAKTKCVILKTCLCIGLQAMSYFTPFISDELLQYLPNASEFQTYDWINTKLENDVDEMLQICYAIRHLKSENNIIKKDDPKVHIYATNVDLYNRLQLHRENIQVLTLSSDVLLHNSLNSQNIKFHAQSTANHLCCFGITTNNLHTNNSNDVVFNKKLKKLNDDLDKMLKTVSFDGYKRNANEKIQAKHQEKIKQLQTEIDRITNMNTNR